MIVNILNNVINSYPSQISLGAGIIGGTAALEMFVRIFKDIKDRNMENLSKDLGGTLFYGLLAANIVPYTAVAGATIFITYSLLYGKKHQYNNDPYLTSQAIHKFVNTLLNRVIKPIAEKVSDVVEFVFNKIIWPAVSGIAKAFSFIIPKEPIWFGVTAVVILIAGYYFVPMLMKPVGI